MAHVSYFPYVPVSLATDSGVTAEPCSHVGGHEWNQGMWRGTQSSNTLESVNRRIIEAAVLEQRGGMIHRPAERLA